MIPFNYCFSQTISTITPEQIKTANKIFIEHSEFSKKIPLLKQQISNLEYANNKLVEQDSINKINYSKINLELVKKNEKIDELNLSIKNRNKGLIWGSVALVVLTILCILK